MIKYEKIILLGLVPEKKKIRDVSVPKHFLHIPERTQEYKITSYSNLTTHDFRHTLVTISSKMKLKKHLTFKVILLRAPPQLINRKINTINIMHMLFTCMSVNTESK